MRILLLLCFLLLLVGCGTTPPAPRIVYVYPDSGWTRPVSVAPPPDQKAFEQATIEQRMKMFAEAYKQQTLNVQTCNTQLNTIEQWVTEHKAKDTPKQ